MRYVALPWIFAFALVTGCTTDATETEDSGGGASVEDSGPKDSGADVGDASGDAWLEVDASDLVDATIEGDASDLDGAIDDASTSPDASEPDASIDDASVPSDAGDDLDAGDEPDASTVDAGDPEDAGFDAGSDAGFDAGVDAGRDSGVGPVCGNGIVELGEQCDSDNGCCNVRCLFENANTRCGPALNDCHTFRRCSAQGVCRMSQPRNDGVACMLSPTDTGRCQDGVCE